MKKLLVLIFCILALLSACSPAPTVAVPTAPQTPKAAPNQPASPTEAPPTQPPPPTETPVFTEDPLPPTPTALPPETQQIEFTAEDGTRLVGTYYPAAVNSAPLVVLMHWAGGTQLNWAEVGMASWLQNRGVDIPAPPQARRYDTPYPFTPLPERVSFAVFTFDFRGFGESKGAFSSYGKDLVMDAQAAYKTAASLPGVDPQRVAGIGASIGADAVVDGCNEFCRGALSLAPGDYLEISYASAMKSLDEQGKQVWCLAAGDDPPAFNTCKSVNGEYYKSVLYPSGGHAMALFRQQLNLQPSIESVILDFLTQVYLQP